VCAGWTQDGETVAKTLRIDMTTLASAAAEEAMALKYSGKRRLHRTEEFKGTANGVSNT
jgi:hypothetical protein